MKGWITLITLITKLFLLFPVFSANAKDFGQHGAIYDIKEQDLLKVIEEKLQSYDERGELLKHQEKIASKVEGYAKRPKSVSGIMKARRNTSRNYDPSIVLSEDIRDQNNNIIYPAGTTINPLDHERFDEEWIFINADDNTQVKFANNLYNQGLRYVNETAQKLEIKIVLVSGEAGERIIEGKNYFYYFDQFGVFSKKFGIKNVPSILRQSKTNPKLLEIEEVSLESREDKSNE